MLDMAAAHQHEGIASLIGMIVVEQQPLEIRVALFQYFQQLQNVARGGEVNAPLPHNHTIRSEKLDVYTTPYRRSSWNLASVGSPSAVQPQAHDDPLIRGGRDVHKPFDEGTGRLARLFSLLLMEKAGFDVGRYVSVDRLCERHAAAYYEALNACT